MEEGGQKTIEREEGQEVGKRVSCVLSSGRRIHNIRPHTDN